MHGRHVLIQIGQALDFGDISVIYTIPVLYRLPLAYPHFRVAQSVLDLESLSGIGHLDAFDDVERVAPWNSQPVLNPVMFIHEIGGIDHERIAVPPSDRLTVKAADCNV